MQLKHLRVSTCVFLSLILIYAVYHISYSYCFRIAYRRGETALKEWKSWVKIMERRVYASGSSGETIVREADLPVFLVNSDCFAILTRKNLKCLQNLLSEKDWIDYQFFLEVRNHFILEHFNLTGTNNENIAYK